MSLSSAALTEDAGVLAPPLRMHKEATDPLTSSSLYVQCDAGRPASISHSSWNKCSLGFTPNCPGRLSSNATQKAGKLERVPRQALLCPRLPTGKAVIARRQFQGRLSHCCLDGIGVAQELLGQMARNGDEASRLCAITLQLGTPGIGAEHVPREVIKFAFAGVDPVQRLYALP